MTDKKPTSLKALVEAAASALEAAERRDIETGAEWSIGGVTFAAVGPDHAEFRLDRLVAEAALRTPDTARSVRGRDWVVFQPPELDKHATDRAIAWLASAWRRADGET
jgi:hypothetical protein